MGRYELTDDGRCRACSTRLPGCSTGRSATGVRDGLPVRVTAVREPAVAGMFYPDDPDGAAPDRHGAARRRDRARRRPDGRRLRRAPRRLPLVRVHGRTGVRAAARALPAEIARIVILGPAHRVPLDGAAVPATDRWRTPLGTCRSTRPRRPAGGARPATATDIPHEPEHSLEVQLPFLQLAASGRRSCRSASGRLPAAGGGGAGQGRGRAGRRGVVQHGPVALPDPAEAGRAGRRERYAPSWNLHPSGWKFATRVGSLPCGAC